MVRKQADLPPKVIAELIDHNLRIKAFVSAGLLWQRVLTERERKRLGGDLQQSFAKLGTVGMWRRVRGGSKVRAVIDVARALGFLYPSNYDWLLREIREKPTKTRDARDRPTWDKSSGELRFRGNVIRTVRIVANPSNVQKILDAFQAVNWKQEINNPLLLGQQQLHQALRSLKANLNGIRFQSRMGAQSITWVVG